MPLQSIKQSIAMHHGRRLKVLLLEHCVLMIDVCSTQTSLSGAGFGLQAQKPYLFLPFWYQETWQWVYSSWGCMLVEVGPEFPSRLMCFHTTWQITGSKTYFFSSLMNLSWAIFLTQPLRETKTIRHFSYPKEGDRGHLLSTYSLGVESFNCDTNKNNSVSQNLFVSDSSLRKI